MIWGLLQSSEVVNWPTLGVGGGIAALVIALWRQDRNEAQKQYAKIAEDFRTIVQENTKAITELSGKIASIHTDGDAVTVRLLVEALRKNKVLNVEP